MLAIGSVVVCAALALLIALPQQAESEDGIKLFVAPDGDDGATGTEQEPFATIQRAREVVRATRRAGPVTVYLRGGTYRIAEPIQFGPEDSGTPQCPITYTAYPGELPVIDGGATISGWREGEGGAWTAHLPQVEKGAWWFRQLYVNGQARPRARIPNEGFLRVKGCPEGTPKTVNYHTDCQSFEFAPGDIDPTWTNLDDVEVIVYHFWTDSHLPIESIDAATSIVTFKHRAGKTFTDDFTEDGARYIVENVAEALDEPGEWYLDRATGMLSYIPMPGEDMGKAEVTAPVSPAHIHIIGDPTSREFVEYLTFSDIAFRHTQFQLPVGNSNDQQGSASVPAAILLRGTRHCTFERCRIENLGTFAFELLDGCTHNVFRRNDIRHIGAGGFRLNGGVQAQTPLQRTGWNQIVDNHIGPYGEEYPSAVGVLMMNAESNHVAHNEIHGGWYTGVSVGWAWGYQRSISRDNVVEKNHIHNIGQGLLSDMGGIYTLGISPGTVLRGNLIHDVESHHYGGWGIYNDEGSSHILIEDNVVYGTKFAAYNIHYAKEITVRNNIFALGRLQQLSRSRMEPHKSCFLERNIVYWREGHLFDTNWKDEPYGFYIGPGRDSYSLDSTFDADYNLYFNPDLAAEVVDFNGRTWEQWKQAGKDKHSLYADPLFVDPDGGDFTLRPESPAFGLGFEAIDLSDVGPRAPVGPRSD